MTFYKQFDDEIEMQDNSIIWGENDEYYITVKILDNFYILIEENIAGEDESGTWWQKLTHHLIDLYINCDLGAIDLD